MFQLAFLIGIFGFTIFDLGLLNLLYPKILVLVLLSFALFCFLIFRKELMGQKWRHKLSIYDKSILFFLLIVSVINLVGAVSPELSFDALWYHLTFPKLYLLHHSIFYVPGGLLYYSTIPKLIELLFVPVVALFNEIGAKLIQFVFGILITLSVFKFSRKYFNFSPSLLAAAIFYSNIVVSWESTIAYIDLGRTFFEFLSLLTFVTYEEKLERKWFYVSAIMLGLAISSKLIAILTIIIFIILIFSSKNNLLNKLTDVLKYFLKPYKKLNKFLHRMNF